MNLLDIEKTKNVTVQGYKFEIKFISPLDRIKISQGRMLLQGGNPVESLTESEYIFFENIATVNTCVEEMPEGFNKNESCAGWESIELINEVASEINSFTQEIESKLKKNRPAPGGEQA